jgi:hypothetical protein
MSTPFSCIDFSGADAFLLSKPLLDEHRARMELAQACGGLLMLEEAFRDFPVADEVWAKTDYEGGYFLEMLIATPTGSLAQADSVLLALYEKNESNATIQPGIVDCFDPDSARAGRRSLADLFPTESLACHIENIEQAEHAFKAALNHIHHQARSLFYDHFCGVHFKRGDAPSLALLAGLSDAASLIERARIEPSAGQSMRDTPRSRL